MPKRFVGQLKAGDKAADKWRQRVEVESHTPLALRGSLDICPSFPFASGLILDGKGVRHGSACTQHVLMKML